MVQLVYLRRLLLFLIAVAGLLSVVTLWQVSRDRAAPKKVNFDPYYDMEMMHIDESDGEDEAHVNEGIEDILFEPIDPPGESPSTLPTITHQNLDKKMMNIDESDDYEDELVAHADNVLEPTEVAESPSTLATVPHPDRPWYMSGGQLLPSPAASGKRVAKLWPQEQPDSDRVTDQLMFLPPLTDGDQPLKIKKILMFHGQLRSWGVKAGGDYFRKARCPVDACTITADRAESQDADAILYQEAFISPGRPKPRKQIWIIYFLECPYLAVHVGVKATFNWTASYRRDSDIVDPSARWAYYDDRVKQIMHPERNYATNKTKKVAMIASTCNSRNRRLQYAQELGKHIAVDIYGACGTHRCPNTAAKALDMLDHDYKFYLAFENSNCEGYITEKFFVNGLGRNVLPIVMGARPEDYASVAPYHSYLHVDDFASAQELAGYLHRLDEDDDLYNSYFRWKGTGEFIETYFFCRLCAMLHANYPDKSYRDVNDWWSGPGTCTEVTWKNATKEASHGNFEIIK